MDVEPPTSTIDLINYSNSTLEDASSEDSNFNSFQIILLTSSSWFVFMVVCVGICRHYCDRESHAPRSKFLFRNSSAAPSQNDRNRNSLEEQTEDLTNDTTPRRGSFLGKIRKSVMLGNATSLRESICKLMGIKEDSSTHKYHPENGAFPDDTQCNWLLGTLKYSKILLECDDDERMRIVKRMRRLILPEGHMLVKQGTIGTDLYVLEQGALNVFVDEKRINTILPGWAFGELGFIFSCPRSSTCITKVESVVWVLTKESLADAFDDINNSDAEVGSPMCSPRSNTVDPIQHSNSCTPRSPGSVVSSNNSFKQKLAALDAELLDIEDSSRSDNMPMTPLNSAQTTSSALSQRLSNQGAASRNRSMLRTLSKMRSSKQSDFSDLPRLSQEDMIPHLSRMISDVLLREIQQQEYVGIPDIVSDTIKCLNIEERISIVSELTQLSPQNSATELMQPVPSLSKEHSGRRSSVLSVTFNINVDHGVDKPSPHNSSSTTSGASATTSASTPFVFFE